MCETCGCGSDEATIHGEHEHVLPDGRVVRHTHHHGEAEHHHHDHGSPDHGHAARTESLEIAVLAKNDEAAARNRELFAQRGLVAVNLMSAPGSGKTLLLEKVLVALRERQTPSFVLEGDQATTRDADRIRKAGVPVLQINTGKGCHLEADMVSRGLAELQVQGGGLLFIENVGNLVCPALFDLGESARVVLFSVTEGEDKPLKYPHMFRSADLVLFTKTDLLPHLDFSLDVARENVASVNPRAAQLEVSARTSDGLDELLSWLDARLASLRAGQVRGRVLAEIE
ncbi:MAG: hydrogenase nickel incorporation protein HypB [Myxococcales bacterium]|nr:hydrogenase nickel incorporation protein HypB [Myxococcales bacterium]